MDVSTAIGKRAAALLAIVVALAVAAIASGCGSSAGTGTGTIADIGPVARAADVTARAGGAKVAMTGTVSTEGLTLTMSGQGSFNFAGKEGTFAMSFTGLPASATAQLGSSALEINALYKGSTIYMNMPVLAGKLPHGAKWLKIDLSRVGQDLGLSASSLTSGSSNPMETLSELRAAGADVKVVGHEAVRGVPTTRYAATLNLQKALELKAGGDASKVRSALEKLRATMGSLELPVEAWVDGKGLLRRELIKLSTSASGHSLSVNIASEYFDFGATPTVTPPAESEVFDAGGQALQGLTGG